MPKSDGQTPDRTSNESTPWPTVSGLGPHGERPSTPEMIRLGPELLADVRARSPRVAVVLHTTSSDWSKRQLAGIRAGLGLAGVEIMEVFDCDYRHEAQIGALSTILAARPDALISIPLGGARIAKAFRAVSHAGIELILLDNAPPGLLPETDYASVVSSDNFGLGQIAARLLAPHVRRNGSVGLVSYKVDFFATAQREIAFCRTMQRERPDVGLLTLPFDRPSQAAEAVLPALEQHPDLDGMFIVWDEPAANVLGALSERPLRPAIVTVDLGRAMVDAMAAGSGLKGVAAQRPFEQGHAAARAAIAALGGMAIPPWIVLPGVAVTSGNLEEAYRQVGGEPASPAILAGE